MLSAALLDPQLAPRTILRGLLSPAQDGDTHVRSVEFFCHSRARVWRARGIPNSAGGRGEGPGFFARQPRARMTEQEIEQDRNCHYDLQRLDRSPWSRTKQMPISGERSSQEQESCCTGSRSSLGPWGETPEAEDPRLGLCGRARGDSGPRMPRCGRPRSRILPLWTTSLLTLSVC